MTNKLVHLIELPITFLAIHWQPFFGVLSAVCGAVYYLSMLKTNVIDTKHDGSWRTYIKNSFRTLLNRKR